MKQKEIEFDPEELVRSVEQFRDHVIGKRKMILRKTTLTAADSRRSGKGLAGTASQATQPDKQLVAREGRSRYGRRSSRR